MLVAISSNVFVFPKQYETDTTSKISESETNFVPFSFSLGFETDLNNTVGQGKMLLSGTRSAFDNLDIELSTELFDKGYQFTGSTAFNQDPTQVPSWNLPVFRNSYGVSLDLSGYTEESALDGVPIMLNGVQYGTIQETDLGVIIRYIDGSFESF